MPVPILLKRSATAGAVPAATSLSAGELAINTADGVVYTKKGDGTIAAIGPFMRGALTADAANAGNVTTDVNALTVSIPANSLTSGRIVEVWASGILANAAVASTYNFWVKLGTTKILTLTAVTPATAQTGRVWSTEFNLTSRVVGATGTLSIGGVLRTNASATTIALAQSTTDVAINTTVANNLIFGFNWTTANASNIITAKQVIIMGS